MLGFPSWASRGGGVNCAVFPSPRTAVIPQYLIFQFSQHRCLKALILVLCYFGHYFLCRKIYSSCYPIHFFSSRNWACSFNFLFTALIGKLLPLPHTNVCQTLDSFCSLKKFELRSLPVLPECCGLLFQGTVMPYITHSSCTSSHFPCDPLLRESFQLAASGP